MTVEKKDVDENVIADAGIAGVYSISKKEIQIWWIVRKNIITNAVCSIVLVVSVRVWNIWSIFMSKLSVENLCGPCFDRFQRKIYHNSNVVI